MFWSLTFITPLTLRLLRSMDLNHFFVGWFFLVHSRVLRCCWHVCLIPNGNVPYQVSLMCIISATFGHCLLPSRSHPKKTGHSLFCHSTFLGANIAIPGRWKMDQSPEWASPKAIKNAFGCLKLGKGRVKEFLFRRHFSRFHVCYWWRYTQGNPQHQKDLTRHRIYTFKPHEQGCRNLAMVIYEYIRFRNFGGFCLIYLWILSKSRPRQAGLGEVSLHSFGYLPGLMQGLALVQNSRRLL